MKTTLKITAIAFMLCFTVQLFAQHEKEIKNSEVEGLYLTFSDFQNDKLTRPTDKRHEGDKIKLKQFFISPDIISIEQDKETVFHKDSIFAIHLTNGENYRFINRNSCKIVDTSFLFIYSYETTKNELNNFSSRSRLKKVPVTYYYFSTKPHNKVFPLTMANIRTQVLKEPKLHTAVCDEFSRDEMLTVIDSETGQFMINKFILEHIKNQ